MLLVWVRLFGRFRAGHGAGDVFKMHPFRQCEVNHEHDESLGVFGTVAPVFAKEKHSAAIQHGLHRFAQEVFARLKSSLAGVLSRSPSISAHGQFRIAQVYNGGLSQRIYA